MFESEKDSCISPVDMGTTREQSRYDGESLLCDEKKPANGMASGKKGIRLNKTSHSEQMAKSKNPSIELPIFEQSEHKSSPELTLHSKLVGDEEIFLIPEDKNKINDKTNKWSFLFEPTVGALKGESHYIHGQYAQGKNKLNTGFSAKGHLLDLNVQVNSPLGALNHSITFGNIDASMNVRYNLDLEDPLGGVGAIANGRVNLFETNYDYKSPVICAGETGLEFETGASLNWGWQSSHGADLSLTRFNLPLSGISLPGPWGTQLNLDGYGGFTRTPHHPECIPSERKEALTGFSEETIFPTKTQFSSFENEQTFEINTEENGFSPSDENSRQNAFSTPHDSLFNTPSSNKTFDLIEIKPQFQSQYSTSHQKYD